MNLRQKNKKLKRELAEARAQLAYDKEFIDQARRTVREAKDYINKRVGDIGVLQAFVHKPEYMMLSEEQFRKQIIKQWIPELAKCVILEDCDPPQVYMAGNDYVHASIRVVMPR